MANGQTTIAFDTLAATRTLEEAGVERQQAEAHANIVAAAVAGSGLATKADLAELETRLAELETRLTVRLYGGLLALGALMVALKLFS